MATMGRPAQDVRRRGAVVPLVIALVATVTVFAATGVHAADPATVPVTDATVGPVAASPDDPAPHEGAAPAVSGSEAPAPAPSDPPPGDPASPAPDGADPTIAPAPSAAETPVDSGSPEGPAGSDAGSAAPGGGTDAGEAMPTDPVDAADLTTGPPGDEDGSHDGAVADEPAPNGRSAAAPAGGDDPDAAPERSALRAATAPTTSALTLASPALQIRLTTPFAAIPTSIDLGPRPELEPASAIVTLRNDTGSDVTVDITGSGQIQLGTNDTCGAGGTPVEVVGLTLAAGVACELELVVDTAVAGTVSGAVEISDGATTASVTVTGEVFSGGPPNDAAADALDLSGRSLPTIVTGTTEDATNEAGESGAGTRSVWYSYTSTGIGGRLGYRIRGGYAEVYAVPCAASFPSFAAGCGALGETGNPTDGWVRMEPGHTVLFRIVPDPPGAAGMPFTLELFEDPNPLDSIANAFRADRFGGGSAAVYGFREQDTFDLTADVSGRGPNAWYTFVLNVQGDLTVEIASESASGERVGRPVGLGVFRAPTRGGVQSPSTLTFVGDGTIVTDVSGNPTGTTRFEDTLQPGRYYLSVEEASSTPTFYELTVFFPDGWGGDTVPPTPTILTPEDEAVYVEGFVPPTVEYECTDDVTANPIAEVGVDGVATTAMASSIGPHEVLLTCTDAAGNSSTAVADYTVVAAGADPTIRASGPSTIVAGQVEFVTVTVENPSTTEGVAAGTTFRVVPQFTVRRAGAPLLDTGVSCVEQTGPGWACTIGVELGPGASTTSFFPVRAPANGPHDACVPVDADGDEVGPRDITGPVCLNVAADVDLRFSPGVDGSLASIPLVGPSLRFDVTAVDDGSTVTLTVVPRNPGTSPLLAPGIVVGPFFTNTPFRSATAPTGWTCDPDPFGRPLVRCGAPGGTIPGGTSGEPIVLRFDSATPPTGSVPCPFTPHPLPQPTPDPCGAFQIYWASADGQAVTWANTAVYRIGGELVDTTPPTIDAGPSIVGFRGDGPTTQPTFTFTSTDDRPGSLTVECRVTATNPTTSLPSFVPTLPVRADPQPDWAPCSSPFSVPGLAEGWYNLFLRATDAAGNVGSSLVRFAVDATPPEALVWQRTGGTDAPLSIVDGATVTADQVPEQIVRACRDSILRGYRFSSSAGGVEFESDPLPTPVRVALLPTSMPRTVGTHSFTVSCTNVVGLTTATTLTYTVVESGPCVIVDTTSIDLGDVPVGSTSAPASVGVRSCSDAPVDLAVSVSAASRSGATETWMASTSTVAPLATGQFRWTVTPPGGVGSGPIAAIPTVVGPPLAALAFRSDDHRIRLGPSGPGLGSAFTTTITYTALAPP